MSRFVCLVVSTCLLRLRLPWFWFFARPVGWFYLVDLGRLVGRFGLFRCVGFRVVGLVGHLDSLDSLVGCFDGYVFPLLSSLRRFDFFVHLPCLFGGHLAPLRIRGLEWVFVEFY